MERNNYKFDLEAAKAGRPVMSENGEKVELVRFDLNNELYPILGIITHWNGTQDCEQYTLDGRRVRHTSEDLEEGDLVMVPLEYEDTFWINLYLGRDSRVVAGNGVFSSEEKAKEESCLAAFGLTYLDTVAVKVEWHEGEPQPSTAEGE